MFLQRQQLEPFSAQSSGRRCVRAADAVTRLPVQVTTHDLERAALIVALKHAEHLPLPQERFPAWAKRSNSGTLTMHRKCWA
jgi:hypothetical protein